MFLILTIMATPDPYTPEGCFIATASYGTSTHPKIDLLRDFRDEYLKGNKAGEWFVRNYYRYGPFFARFIARHPVLKNTARVFLVEPTYRAVKKLFYS